MGDVEFIRNWPEEAEYYSEMEGNAANSYQPPVVATAPMATLSNGAITEVELRRKWVSEVRDRLKSNKPALKATQNVAVAEVCIDGKTNKYEAISGKISPPNTTRSPDEGKRMFTTKSSGAMTRDYDTEVKILEDIAKDLTPSSKGKISLHTERSPCFSCQYVIKQFKEKFPNVEIVVTHD